MQPLAEIVKDPDYQALDPTEKAQVRMKYALALKAKPAISTEPKEVEKATDETSEFIKGVAKRLAPFPGLLHAIKDPATLPRREVPGQKEPVIDMGYLLNPIPKGIQEGAEALQGAISKYVSPEAANLVEAGPMAAVGMGPVYTSGMRGIQNRDLYRRSRATADPEVVEPEALKRLPAGKNLYEEATIVRPPPPSPRLESPAKLSADFFEQQRAAESALAQSSYGGLRLRQQLQAQSSPPAEAVPLRPTAAPTAPAAPAAPTIAPAIPPKRAEAIAQGQARVKKAKPNIMGSAPPGGWTEADKVPDKYRKQPAAEPPVLTAPEVVEKIESQQDPKFFDKPAIEKQVEKSDTYHLTEVDPEDLKIRPGLKSGWDISGNQRSVDTDSIMGSLRDKGFAEIEDVSTKIQRDDQLNHRGWFVEVTVDGVRHELSPKGWLPSFVGWEGIDGAREAAVDVLRDQSQLQRFAKSPASAARPDKGPIVIDDKGKVIDGNHRAADAKEAGETVEAYVPDALNPERPTALDHAVMLKRAGQGSDFVIRSLIDNYKLKPMQARNLEERARHSLDPKIVTPQVAPGAEAAAAPMTVPEGSKNPTSLMGIPVKIANFKVDADNIKYEIYVANDKTDRGVIRQIDLDSGNTITIKAYPNTQMAIADWVKMGTVKGESAPSAPGNADVVKDFLAGGRDAVLPDEPDISMSITAETNLSSLSDVELEQLLNSDDYAVRQQAQGEIARRNLISTPIDIPPEGTQIETQEAPDVHGQLLQNPSELDVRQPAAPSPATDAIEQTERPPRPEGTGGGGLSSRPQGENVPAGSLGDSDPADIRPAGRPSDVGQPAETAGLEGAEGDLQLPGESGGSGGPGGVAGGAETLAPVPTNYVLPRDHDWIPTGDKTRVRANLDAIRIVKQLDSEGRPPTIEEQESLTKFVGWGSVKPIFDEGNAYYRTLPSYRRPPSYENWEKQWGKLYDEVKAELTPEEWSSAAESILNAHYTSRTVINAMWSAAARLGFTGGRALEPAAGIGHFIGLQPESTRHKTQWRAVEMDDYSAKIAQYLYPEARVERSPFEKSKIQPNSQDLVISNVPFLEKQLGTLDTRYPDLALHNYFFVRGLDLVKPGGMMISITSDSTLDNGASKKARDMIAERADLVGAIRLPNIAFKGNAGTEVTADILFLRKKDAHTFDGERFGIVGEAKTYKNQPIEINEYYVAHPEMLLGRLSKEGTMHEAEQNALLPTNPHTELQGREKLDRQLSELKDELAAAIEKLRPDVMGATTIPEDVPAAVTFADAGDKEGTLQIKNQGVFKVVNKELVRPEWASNAEKLKQAKQYIPIRDFRVRQVSLEKSTESTDEQIEIARGELADAYQGYVQRYGPINGPKSSFLEDDVDFALAASLEDKDVLLTDSTRKGQRYIRQQAIWKPSAILTKRVNFPDTIPVSADNVGDGMQISLNYRGMVEPEYVSDLTGQPLADVMAAMEQAGLAFENPKTGIWEPRNEYLSGNVKQKLLEATRAAEDDPRFQTHVTELTAVQPPPSPIERMKFTLGSKWLPPEAVQQFAREVLGVDLTIRVNPVNARWSLDLSSYGGSGAYDAQNVSVLGFPGDAHHNGVMGHKLVELAMNLKKPIIKVRYMDEQGEIKERKDVALTFRAEQRQKALQDKFRAFVKSSPEISGQVEGVYNERFIGSIDRQWEPPSWTYYPGAGHEIELARHQKSGVTRLLRESTMLGHGVGTGKTFIMVTWAMELKRLGLGHKGIIATQNATTEQFARQAKRLYPNSKVLAPTEHERSATERNSLMARIATGDWDIVIVPHSFIDLLPNDPVRERAYITERIQELQQAIMEARHREGRKSPTAAELQKALKKLRQKLDKIAARRQDGVIYFEDLGIDFMAVDESQYYKKLDFTTLMDNIKGLDKSYTDKGFGLYMKTRYINEKRGQRNLVFASGTPISNTMAESWNIMRHLRPDLLKERGIEKFDEFAGTFTEPRTDLEMTPTGNFKMETRLSRFKNEDALMTLWKAMADVKFAEEVIGEGLPSVKGGGPRLVMSEMTPEYKEFLGELQERLDEFAQMTGDQRRENSWIPMWVQGQAIKGSVDMRMIKPRLSDQPNSKLNTIVREAVRIYNESTDVKGTQAIFIDRFRSSPKNTLFNLHEEAKRKLVKEGIPEKEILVVDQKLKGPRREAMFKAIDDGVIRIVIGTRKKIGVGVNYQEHNIGILQGDVPWLPMELEQSTGRGLRQRQNKEINQIEILHFTVLGSFDSAMYGIISRKLKMINQVMKGNWPKGEEDPFDSATMTFDQMMAESSGNPRAIEKVGLENDIRMLEMAAEGHAREVRDSRREIAGLVSTERPGGIPGAERALAAAERTARQFAELFPPDVEVQVGLNGKIFTDHKEAVAAIDEYMKASIAHLEGESVKANRTGSIQSNLFQNIKLNGQWVVMKIDLTRKPTVVGMDKNDKAVIETRFSDSHISWHLADADAVGENRASTGVGLFTGLRSQLERISRLPQDARDHLARLQRDFRNLTEFTKTPFPQGEELIEKKAQLAALILELGATVPAGSFAMGETVEWTSEADETDSIEGTFLRQEGGLAVVRPKAGGVVGEEVGLAAELRIPMDKLRTVRAPMPREEGAVLPQDIVQLDEGDDADMEDSDD